MKIDPIVLYCVTDLSDLPKIEEIIKRDDEEAFALHGSYFKEQKGSAYLINTMDIGMGSDAQSYLQERYDAQGGVEITGTEDELREFECFFDFPDCLACRLGDRFLVLPDRALYADLVVCLMQRANSEGYKRRRLLMMVLREGVGVIGWPYLYIRHCYQQMKRMHPLTWQLIIAAFLSQFVWILSSFLVSTVLFGYPSSTVQHVVALLFAYMFGGLGMFLACPFSFGRDVGKEEAQNARVLFKGYPQSDIALGFIIASVIQFFIGRF